MILTDTRILQELYRRMLQIRKVEEKIAELYPEQEMRCPVHLCIGQEAIPVGVCANLLAEDCVLSAHRSHGHYLAKGGNLNAMMAELYGKKTGCSGGKGGSMHLVDIEAGFLGSTPIVGSTIPIAVGVAFASVSRGERRVVVVFFGEAAIEEGVFHESLNFAALKKLPVLFVCENNLYSVYSPLSVRQPNGREVYTLAKSHGIASYHGDGNDIFEVFNLAQEATAEIRQGGGPIFLEFKTYRWLEHCGPNLDNHLGYRTRQEFEEWKRRCPLKKKKEYLRDKKLMCDSDFDRIASEIDAEIQSAVRFAKESSFPEEHLLLKHVYAP
ncbi:MAG: thiamine pyrophosphate-dependent dehydrogenase E1 component subunit alpha [Candidatus Omnitrophica bacterium]|nr:thiamine pyrophosphate-dependent dehydrogenase E1 component subunit alpha [Candidatus Omnitrophota bacterium]